MLILALETSCDETAASIVEDGRAVRSSIVASQFDLHADYGGVVPEIASRAHVERILPVIRAALDRASLTLKQIDAIAVGHRPGLIGSLLVGVAAAKALAWSLGKPLIGVDHVHAHLYSGLLEAPDQSTIDHAFPALGLVVSGGHTSLYRCDSPTQLTRLGATIDDAMGEAFDKAATILGLPYPGGPNLDRLASTPGADPRAVKFPISRLAPDSLNFSFSGLKTALLYTVRGLPAPGGIFSRDHTNLDEKRRADLAASFQHAAVEAAVLKLNRAIDSVNADPAGREPLRAILTGGGVTANSHLRAALKSLAARRNLQLFLPRPDFCVDNAAMIAGLGYHLLQAGHTSDLTLAATPTTAC